jgi:hypothetical protein
VLDRGVLYCIIQKNIPIAGGKVMMVRVIYKDQTAGVIESHLLDTLIRKGRIVAYHSADRWVPVEPKTVQAAAGVKEILRNRDGLRKYNLY